MSKEKIHEVKESRIKELAKSCPEYDKAMRTLFPEAFEGEEKNITAQMEWRLSETSGGGCFLEGFYKGHKIAFVNPTNNYEPDSVGVRISFFAKDHYYVVHDGGHTFKIIKKRSQNE